MKIPHIFSNLNLKMAPFQGEDWQNVLTFSMWLLFKGHFVLSGSSCLERVFVFLTDKSTVPIYPPILAPYRYVNIDIMSADK